MAPAGSLASSSRTWSPRRAALGSGQAGTLAELLDQWIEAASPGWSAYTVSHTRSIVECHLKPHLDHLDLAKLTTANDLPPQSATSDSRWREGDGPGCQLPMIGSKVRGLGPWAVR
jgi:hypothetical protein